MRLRLLLLCTSLYSSFAVSSDSAAAPAAGGEAPADAADSASPASAPAPLSLAELRALRVPALKAMLAARGQECDGCAEKDDYVALAHATQHLPTATPAPATPAPAAPDVDVEELMRRFNMGKQGGGGRMARIKRKLEARGLDMSGVNLAGMSGFESLDDATLERLLETLAGGGAPPAAGGDDGGEDGGSDTARRRAPRAAHRRAAPEPELANVETAEVIDDDGGEL